MLNTSEEDPTRDTPNNSRRTTPLESCFKALVHRKHCCNGVGLRSCTNCGQCELNAIIGTHVVTCDMSIASHSKKPYCLGGSTMSHLERISTEKYGTAGNIKTSLYTRSVHGGRWCDGCTVRTPLRSLQLSIGGPVQLWC